MAPNLVLYHSRCSDGFGAAFAAWLALGDRAEYIPMQYDDPLPDPAGRTVWLLDYARSRADLAKLASGAAQVIVLDHHLTALEALQNWRDPPANLTLVLDLEHSGAWLAWRHFHPGRPVPLLIQHIEDRDLWRWRLPQSAAFLAHLDSLPHDFAVWQSISDQTAEQYAQFVEVGAALDRQFQRQCQDFAQRAFPLCLDGVLGLQANAGSLFVSQVGNLLAQRSGTFGAVWQVTEPARVKVSLRAAGDLDVARMAERHGGGGHRAAAGFVLPIAQLPQLVAGSITAPAPTVG